MLRKHTLRHVLPAGSLAWQHCRGSDAKLRCTTARTTQLPRKQCYSILGTASSMLQRASTLYVAGRAASSGNVPSCQPHGSNPWLDLQRRPVRHGQNQLLYLPPSNTNPIQGTHLYSSNSPYLPNSPARPCVSAASEHCTRTGPCAVYTAPGYPTHHIAHPPAHPDHPPARSTHCWGCQPPGPPYSSASFSRGTMFMLCNSWNSSLQA